MLVWSDTLGQLNELPCAMDMADDDRAAMGCDGVCAHRAGLYLGTEYDSCPVGQARMDPQIRTVCELERMSSLGLLNGALAEGDRYAAWVPALWAELRSVQADRRAQEAR